MIDQKYIDSLTALGTDTTPHSGRTLFDHLKGVHDLLQEWGNSEAICLAGLYHSIYGTQAFKIKTVGLDQRDSVRAVIGETAEQLAYFFCVSDRKSFYPDHPGTDPLQIHDLVHDKNVDVSDEQVTQLIEIEAANYLDQFEAVLAQFPKERVQVAIDRFLRHSDRLSPKGLAGIKTAEAALQAS